DVDALGALHRLDLARQLGRGRLGEGDARDEIRVLGAVALDRVLRQREVAGDVDDVEGNGAFRQRGRLRQRLERNERGERGGDDAKHGAPPLGRFYFFTCMRRIQLLKPVTRSLRNL